MAENEIEISELEFTQELAGDNLIPVESSTDTKATSLQILKDWLLSFFVGKTGNETIGGNKTFTSPIERKGAITSAGVYIDRMTDDNIGSLERLSYYTGRALINRMMTRNTASGGKVCYLDVTTSDTGNGTLTFNGNTTTKLINFTTATQVKVVTPEASDNSSSAATTAWFHNNKSTIANWGTPNYSAGVELTTPYTVAKDGVINMRAGGNNRTSWVDVDGVRVFDSGWGASYGSPDNCQIRVGAGQVITFQGTNCQFYPLKGA